MHFISISWTHKNSDIAFREKLSLDSLDRKKELLRLISSSENISESMALGTCNRVEIFAVCEDLRAAASHILSAVSIITLVSVEALSARADIYEDEGAIHHLFSVASSLDSLVIGETHIAGQLKEAFKFAYDGDYADKMVSSAIHYAFKCAASVRSSTDISKNPVSVSSVAVAQAKEQYGDLNGAKALIIGAGEMSRIMAQHLYAAGADITIINRSIERAKQVATEIENSGKSAVKVAQFSELANLLATHQLIFSATSSPVAVITDINLPEAPFKRYFFDIAVPRDILLSASPLVSVFAVDDLDCIVKQNMALREEQATAAYAIISRFVGEFFSFIHSKRSAPAIKALRDKARICAQEQLNIAIKKGYVRHCDKDEIKRLIHQVFRAFLHTPSVKLKENSSEVATEMLSEIFGLNLTELKD